MQKRSAKSGRPQMPLRISSSGNTRISCSGTNRTRNGVWTMNTNKMKKKSSAGACARSRSNTTDAGPVNTLSSSHESETSKKAPPPPPPPNQGSSHESETSKRAPPPPNQAQTVRPRATMRKRAGADSANSKSADACANPRTPSANHGHHVVTAHPHAHRRKSQLTSATKTVRPNAQAATARAARIARPNGRQAATGRAARIARPHPALLRQRRRWPRQAPISCPSSRPVTESAGPPIPQPPIPAPVQLQLRQLQVRPQWARRLCRPRPAIRLPSLCLWTRPRLLLSRPSRAHQCLWLTFRPRATETRQPHQRLLLPRHRPRLLPRDRPPLLPSRLISRHRPPLLPSRLLQKPLLLPSLLHSLLRLLRRLQRPPRLADVKVRHARSLWRSGQRRRRRIGLPRSERRMSSMAPASSTTIAPESCFSRCWTAQTTAKKRTLKPSGTAETRAPRHYLIICIFVYVLSRIKNSLHQKQILNKLRTLVRR